VQIHPGVHRIDTDFGGRTNAIYLLAGSERVVLVDTGIDATPRQYLVPYLREQGLDRVDVVVSTHADLDHTGGNAAVGELFPASLAVCHVLDRDWVDDVDALIEERYDEYAVLGLAEPAEDKESLRAIARARPTALAVTGGERVRLEPGWEIELLHVPGHSHGHLTVWDSRSRSLVVGDAVLADGLYFTDGRPAFPPTYRYVDDYLASIDRLRGYRAGTLLTAHYPTMYGDDVDAFFTTTSGFVATLDGVLVELLAGSDPPATLPELVEAAAPRVGPWEGGARLPLKFPVLGHLERLESSGRLVRDPGPAVPRFRWQG
jgi:glyoxylase-like metal-dependent hydrolase (beta-lactamase superfamily II)